MLDGDEHAAAIVIRVALKGLLGRKLRAALTALAIVLGVAMVCGTYILTDTIKAAFSTVFTKPTRTPTPSSPGKSAIGDEPEQRDRAAVPSLPESLLAQSSALPGVDAAAGGDLATRRSSSGTTAR